MYEQTADFHWVDLLAALQEKFEDYPWENIVRDYMNMNVGWTCSSFLGFILYNQEPSLFLLFILKINLFYKDL